MAKRKNSQLSAEEKAAKKARKVEKKNQETAWLLAQAVAKEQSGAKMSKKERRRIRRAEEAGTFTRLGPIPNISAMVPKAKPPNQAPLPKVSKVALDDCASQIPPVGFYPNSSLLDSKADVKLFYCEECEGDHIHRKFVKKSRGEIVHQERWAAVLRNEQLTELCRAEITKLTRKPLTERSVSQWIDHFRSADIEREEIDDFIEKQNTENILIQILPRASVLTALGSVFGIDDRGADMTYHVSQCGEDTPFNVVDIMESLTHAFYPDDAFEYRVKQVVITAPDTVNNVADGEGLFIFDDSESYEYWMNHEIGKRYLVEASIPDTPHAARHVDGRFAAVNLFVNRLMHSDRKGVRLHISNLQKWEQTTLTIEDDPYYLALVGAAVEKTPEARRHIVRTFIRFARKWAVTKHLHRKADGMVSHNLFNVILVGFLEKEIAMKVTVSDGVDKKRMGLGLRIPTLEEVQEMPYYEMQDEEYKDVLGMFQRFLLFVSNLRYGIINLTPGPITREVMREFHVETSHPLCNHIYTPDPYEPQYNMASNIKLAAATYISAIATYSYYALLAAQPPANIFALHCMYSHDELIPVVDPDAVLRSPSVNDKSPFTSVYTCPRKVLYDQLVMEGRVGVYNSQPWAQHWINIMLMRDVLRRHLEGAQNKDVKQQVAKMQEIQNPAAAEYAHLLSSSREVALNGLENLDKMLQELDATVFCRPKVDYKTYRGSFQLALQTPLPNTRKGTLKAWVTTNSHTEAVPYVKQFYQVWSKLTIRGNVVFGCGALAQALPCPRLYAFLQASSWYHLRLLDATHGVKFPLCIQRMETIPGFIKRIPEDIWERVMPNIHKDLTLWLQFWTDLEKPVAHEATVLMKRLLPFEPFLSLSMVPNDVIALRLITTNVVLQFMHEEVFVLRRRYQRYIVKHHPEDFVHPDDIDTYLFYNPNKGEKTEFKRPTREPEDLIDEEDEEEYLRVYLDLGDNEGERANQPDEESHENPRAIARGGAKVSTGDEEEDPDDSDDGDDDPNEL